MVPIIIIKVSSFCWFFELAYIPHQVTKHDIFQVLKVACTPKTDPRLSCSKGVHFRQMGVPEAEPFPINELAECQDKCNNYATLSSIFGSLWLHFTFALQIGSKIQIPISLFGPQIMHFQVDSMSSCRYVPQEKSPMELPKYAWFPVPMFSHQGSVKGALSALKPNCPKTVHWTPEVGWQCFTKNHSKTVIFSANNKLFFYKYFLMLMHTGIQPLNLVMDFSDNMWKQNLESLTTNIVRY